MVGTVVIKTGVHTNLLGMYVQIITLVDMIYE